MFVSLAIPTLTRNSLMCCRWSPENWITWPCSGWVTTKEKYVETSAAGEIGIVNAQSSSRFGIFQVKLSYALVSISFFFSRKFFDCTQMLTSARDRQRTANEQNNLFKTKQIIANTHILSSIQNPYLFRYTTRSWQGIGPSFPGRNPH